MPGLRRQVETSRGAATPWGTAHLVRQADGRCAVPPATKPNLYFRMGCDIA
jgi:hypothetical protein